MHYWIEMKSRLTICLLLLGVAFTSTYACQICRPFPEESAADRLMEGEVVVLAREDPDRPFNYRPVEVLKGNPGDEPIDLFLKSSSRRLLAADAKAAVVIVGTRSGEGKQEWSSIGFADGETGPVIRAILDAAPAWKEDPNKRIQFFAARLGHRNPRIREMAHLEVTRAPYREIRKLHNAIPREEIHRFLAEMRYIEWHALYIHLLAQSNHPEDHAFIAQSLRSAARCDTTIRLAAWATASIEIEEEKAVDFIESAYFRNPDRTAEELKAVLGALSVHGTDGHTHLRARIVASYETLLAHHPAMTPEVAVDLISWKRTELADRKRVRWKN